MKTSCDARPDHTLVKSGRVDHVGGLTRMWQVPVNRRTETYVQNSTPPRLAGRPSSPLPASPDIPDDAGPAAMTDAVEKPERSMLRVP
jgi:hypothetical protein